MMEKKLRNLIKDHVRSERGPCLLTSKLPLNAHAGVGHVFDYKGKKLVSKCSETSSGKRILEFRITSFRGLSIGAIHYYCTAESPMFYEFADSPGWTYGVLTHNLDIPREAKPMTFHITRILSQEEIDDDPQRWAGYDPGDKVIAFESEEEILEIIEQLRPAFGDDWEIEIIS